MPLDLKQHDNGFWYVVGTVTVWRGGRVVSEEVRKSTRTRNRREADAIKRQIEGAVAEQNISGREPAITFNAAADRYVANGGEDRYLAKPRGAFGRLRIDEITQAMIDDEGMKAYPANTATRRRQFHGPVIAVLHANGVKQQFDRPDDSPKRTYFLRPGQAVSMIGRVVDSRTPNPWTPAFVTFLFGQGSRISETLAVDGRNDISLSNRYAILRDTKNGQERMVALCPRTIAALTVVPNLGRPGPLFLRYDGRPYTPKDDDSGYSFGWWERAIREIGLNPRLYTPHTARHSWATWFYSQTKDVLRLKAEGGWNSDEWTRYVKLANAQIGVDAARAGFDFGQNAIATEFADILRK